MPNFKKDSCPVCYSSSFKIIGNATLGNIPIDKPRDSKIVICRDCETIYVNPMPYWTDKDFDLLYNADYFTENKTQESKEQLDLRQYINPDYRFSQILRYLRSDSNSLLEIGSGIYAYMCKFLANKKWSVTAQEPSKSFHGKLCSQIPGVSIIGKDFLEINTDIKYSLLYADSVMEHIPNPNEYFHQAAKLLEKGGIFYFICPNEHNFYNFMITTINKVRSKSVRYLCPYTDSFHLIGYSKKALSIMAKKYGFEFVRHYKGRDFSWFQFSRLKYVPMWIRYPIAVILQIADYAGFGRNQEIIFRKN